MTHPKMKTKKTSKTEEFIKLNRQLSVPEIYVPECMNESDFGNVLRMTMVKIVEEEQQVFVLELPTGYTGGNSPEGIYRLRVSGVDFEASK